MKTHKEGYKTLILSTLVLLLLNTSWLFYLDWLKWIVVPVTLGLFLFLLRFFRHPRREVPVKDDRLIYAPADGKIVAIEETREEEYFHDRRIQVSIFMSPMNVHVNRSPATGIVAYKKYHPGKYLVAWHPKSSEENERMTIVLENNRGKILFRQIAGAVARRIVNYLQEGMNTEQGDEIGFIKFGSRVDVLLPLDAEIKVWIGQEVKAALDVIAEW